MAKARTTTGPSRRAPANRREKDVRKIVEGYDRQRQAATDEWQKEYEAYLRRQGGRQEGGDKTPVTPFLVIRYSPTDLGARPIPSGIPFWSSPDIYVESSDPAGNPVAGEANFLHARVFNLGAFQAAPVQVDFYWANPALGLGPANMNFIGSEWVQVPSLWSTDVRCSTPWVPVMANNGHECVLVNCSNPLLDPIIDPFQPTLDRHVGQRNLHVVAASPGQSLRYSLQVNNPFPIAMPARVTASFGRLRIVPDVEASTRELGAAAGSFGTREIVSPLRMASAMKRGTRAHLTAQRTLALARRRHEEPPEILERVDAASPATVVAHMTEETGAFDGRGGAKAAGALLASLDEFREVPDRSAREIDLGGEAQLEPWTFKTADVVVTIPADAQKGDIFVTQIAQIAGPLTAGGYTIVARIE